MSTFDSTSPNSLPRLVADCAKDFRAIRTQAQVLRRKYDTSEKRAAFVDHCWNRVQKQTTALANQARRRFQFDAQLMRCLSGFSTPTGREAQELYEIILKVQAGEVHLQALAATIRDAEAAGEDPIEAGFDALLDWKVLAPVAVSCAVAQSDIWGDEATERATGLISGWVESITDLSRNPRLKAYLASTCDDLAAKFREELPAAVRCALSELPKGSNAFADLKLETLRAVTGREASTKEVYGADLEQHATESLESQILQAAEANALLEGFRSLPAEVRTILELVADGHSYKEIGEKMGKKLNTVQVALRRARERLRNEEGAA